MSDLIEINKFPVKDVLKYLLKDKTTGKNIIFATDMYAEYSECSTMTELAVRGFASCDIQPRVRKAQIDQNYRTRKKAEVFTPTWICNIMNNFCDSEWFGRDDVFNQMDSENKWHSVCDRIVFPDGKSWQEYVDLRRLEITCGEAPYLVSRYDTTTGELIPIHNRIGMLDRKMRIVGENTDTEEEWFKWAVRAFQSIYGYEFQGDNLLIARINLLLTFCDYLASRWNREATKTEVRKIANIISWNIWQMDGLTDTVPVGVPKVNNAQISLFDADSEDDIPPVDCRICDWRSKRPKIFNKLKDKNERGVNMKFDFVIGNPPYQEDNENNNRQSPVYNLFMEEAFKVSDVVELITPARFLFNAGQTPKAWNKKMLNDEHLKVLMYEQEGSKIFPNTDIKGGVAITLHNENKNFGKIGVFTNLPSLNSILRKVSSLMHNSFLECAYPKSNYGFTEVLYEDYPDLKSRLTSGNEYIIDANIFRKMPEIFADSNKENTICVHGRYNNERICRYINKKYIKNSIGVDQYKVFVTGANGTGKFGETLSRPFVGLPFEVGTQTYMSFGFFKTFDEANNCMNYIKSKFARCMLGVLKVTQNNPRDTWAKIPLQDFTPNSDIDWSVSIPEIDKQLYKKYGLTGEEIDFIESHVKEMN